MSASQQKKTRAQKREEGVEKRQVAKKKASQAAKKERRTVTIVSVVLLVVTIVLVVFNSSLLYNNFTAVQIGGVSYTASEYSYFYNSSYYSFVNTYGDWLSYFGLDTSKSLSSQTYDEGMTWADYFSDSALSTMESVTMLWTEAQAEGFTLDEEQQAELDESLESLATAYVSAGYPNANRYLSVNYGKGLTVERVSKLVEMSFIASAYAELKHDSFTYADEEIEAYYEENKDEYDYFDFLYYYVSGEADEENGIDSETAMATAKELADSIVSDEVIDTDDADADTDADVDTDADTEADADTADADADTSDNADDEDIDDMSEEERAFRDKVLALTGSEPTSNTTQGVDLSSTYSEWIVDSSRKLGDKTVIEDDSGYYVMFYISRDNNDYQTVNVRHILFKAEAEEDEDGNTIYTDEAKAEALARAEEALAEWKAGDATEDSFAELANTYSDDVDSSGVINTEGGLYEDIRKNYMVTEFNDWIYAPARKVGDTGIVFNEGSYCGYHIIYFSGYSATYRSLLAESDMRSDDYTDWNTEKLESFNAAKGFTAFLVK